MLYEEVVEKEREGLSEALHVLNSSDEEALLAHIWDAEHWPIKGVETASLSLALEQTVQAV